MQKPGTRGADVPGAAILSPWDFLPKVLVTFFSFRGKGEHKVEACSGDKVGVLTAFFKSSLAGVGLFKRGMFRLG